MTTNAIIYARISRDRSGAGLGVERQLEDCRELAKRLGWTVVAELSDNDISAYSGKRRPDYERMLTELESGQVQGVIAWHTDRLHRSPSELERYINLTEKHGVITQTVRAGQLDLSTPSGRMVARMLGAVARQESEHKADRVQRAMHQNARAGKFLGGTVPFGWSVEDGVPVRCEPEAVEVALATRAVIAGRSLGSVVRDFKDRGIKTRNGRDWTHTTLRQVLVRPRNAGLAEWHGEIIGDSQFPALVSRDEWEAVRRILSDPARRSSQSNRAKYLLPGLALCGVCGDRMKTSSVTGRSSGLNAIYRCRSGGKGHPFRTAVHVDAAVSEVMVALLSRPDAAAALAAASAPDVDVAALAAEDQALRARLAEAAETFADGAITGEQLHIITERIQARQRELSAVLAATRPSPAVESMLSADDIRAAWESADIETRRAVVDALAVVRIHPSTRRGGGVFDYDSIKIEPKITG